VQISLRAFALDASGIDRVAGRAGKSKRVNRKGLNREPVGRQLAADSIL
jgi:hypothetical protein